MDQKNINFDALRFDDPDETEPEAAAVPETRKTEYASVQTPRFVPDPVLDAVQEQPPVNEPEPPYYGEADISFSQTPDDLQEPEQPFQQESEPVFFQTQEQPFPQEQEQEYPQYAQEPAYPQYAQEPESPQYAQEPAYPQYAQEPESPQYSQESEYPQYAQAPDYPQAQETYFQSQPGPHMEYQAAAPAYEVTDAQVADTRDYNDYSGYTSPSADLSALPPSGFEMLFGESRILAFLSLLSGVTGISWLILYLSMLLERDSMFTQAIEAMSLQGQYDYSVSFTSPFLGVLRVILYLVPVLALIWSAVVAMASRNNKKLGKKAVLIAVLAVFAIVGIVAVFDVCAAGLVFDIVKN